MMLIVWLHNAIYVQSQAVHLYLLSKLWGCFHCSTWLDKNQCLLDIHRWICIKKKIVLWFPPHNEGVQGMLKKLVSFTLQFWSW